MFVTVSKEWAPVRVPLREADSKEGQLVGGYDEEQWVIIAGGIENVLHENARWYVPIKIGDIT